MTSTVEKLLNCPFCGCKAAWFKTGRDIGIECGDGFDCPGRAQTNVYAPEHQQDVIDQWNRRVDIDGNDIRELAALTPSPAPSAALHQEADALREDAERLRALLRNNGREFNLSNPETRRGKVLHLKLNVDGCEQYREDGALDWAATIRATLDDEIRLAALSQHQPQQGEQHE